MDIDTKQAQESLNAVAETMDRADKSLSSVYANPMLIIWGTLWVASYTASHFYLQHVWVIKWGMSAIGCVGMFFIFKKYSSDAPVRGISTNKVFKKVGWLWFFVYLFVGGWLYILQPFNGMQFNAALVLAVMLAFVLMGLWLDTGFMITLGVSIAATTIIGYALLKPYYCLWMAATGGLVMLLTGLYIRLKWR
jgi:hypothetical protein